MSYPGQLFLEERKGKLGLGTAYIYGFKWSIEKGMNTFLKWMPIFRTTLMILKVLYNACKNDGADVSIGSRYVPGGKTENWPLDRQLYSKAARCIQN
jgi:dolichol-phosphate mannosyltransferase